MMRRCYLTFIFILVSLNAIAQDSTTGVVGNLTQSDTFQYKEYDPVIMALNKRVTDLENKVKSLQSSGGGGGGGGGSANLGTWSCSANGGKSGVCTPKGKVLNGGTWQCRCN
ncbi:hypothetical protein L1D14_07260 [Vibrio tubiashii]|uniref:hypothetical protein n=1 Tax=Vibrio tubiashii TaxID=29498 RepID=UPI001EFD22F6|nr:hypothetical protein [Vibrio tubiashii]MCG9576035.1 hypothetical protein [Vibrio tubiashii]